MENLKNLSFKSYDNNYQTSISTDKQFIKTYEKCSCGLEYSEYWSRVNKKCKKCLKVDELEKIKSEQDKKIKDLETNLQSAIVNSKIKSEKIQRLEIDLNSEKKATFVLNNRSNEKDEIITNLKKKLVEFEAKEQARESLNESLHKINWRATAADPGGRSAQEGEQQQAQQGDLPAEREHRDADHDDRDGAGDRAGQCGGEGALGADHVVVEAGDERYRYWLAGGRTPATGAGRDRMERHGQAPPEG